MLKRLVRHLVDHGRLVQEISEQRRVKAPRVDTDSDYAGCVLARKSTTCAHLFPWRQLAQSRKLDAGSAQLESCARSSTQKSKEDRFCWARNAW